MGDRRRLALAYAYLLGSASLIFAACGSSTPSECEGDGALFTDACAAKLDAICAAHGEDESCEQELPLDFDDDGVFRCGRARGVVFADEAACAVDRIAYTCLAFIDTNEGGDHACTYDQCTPDGEDRRTYLTPVVRDRALIRRPCGPSSQILEGPIIAGAGPFVSTCSPSDGTPPAICACAELACEQLR